jgi:hypothetical protein
MAKSGVDKAATALAAAGGVAHAAFFVMFAWRTHAGESWTSWFNLLWAGLAGVGFLSNFFGWGMVKRNKSRKLGLYGIALSTAIAAVLLFVSAV